MTLDASAVMRRGGARLVVLWALVLGSAEACRYSHGRIRVDGDTKHRWNAGEKEAEEAGKLIVPVADPNTLDSLVPPDSLKRALLHVSPSMRHGAEDKRLLSDPSAPSLSSGIVAKIVLVKGSEYKSEKEFEKGWIPVAIVYRSLEESRSQKPYPRLNLQPVPTSWIFVRKLADATWQGSIVSPNGEGYTQGRLAVTTGKMDSRYQGKDEAAVVDSLEPVIGARFVWDGKDETIWAYCGGKCCKMIAFH
jgi:hypothetical protein